ncbi:MAG: formimidoylglutamase [Bacteroidota bacterium]
MDLQLYFDPVDFEYFQNRKKFSRQVLGYYIERATRGIKDGGTGKAVAALVGVPHETGSHNKGTSRAPQEIRRYLYGLANFDTSLKIIDLGDLKPGKNPQDLYFALRDVTDYLSESGIVTMVLGGSQDLSIGIARAFSHHEEFTMTIADARVDLKSHREPSGANNFITKILRENPALFHLSMLGIQQHYVSPSVFEFLKQNTFDSIQLGDFREDHYLAEPLLRNSHFLSFDISSVKKSDAPGHTNPSPNGFYSEEACLIARYAGLSHRLMAFGLFEVNPSADKTGATGELAAQMVWYFLDGVIRRRKEDPAGNKAAFTRYFVEIEEHGEPLVFYYQPPTNRWWLEIFPEEGKSWIVACRESDYKQAISKEIPDICWKYVRKTNRLSK